MSFNQRKFSVSFKKPHVFNFIQTLPHGEGSDYIENLIELDMCCGNESLALTIARQIQMKSDLYRSAANMKRITDEKRQARVEGAAGDDLLTFYLTEYHKRLMEYDPGLVGRGKEVAQTWISSRADDLKSSIGISVAEFKNTYADWVTRGKTVNNTPSPPEPEREQTDNLSEPIDGDIPAAEDHGNAPKSFYLDAPEQPAEITEVETPRAAPEISGRSEQPRAPIEEPHSSEDFAEPQNDTEKGGVIPDFTDEIGHTRRKKKMEDMYAELLRKKGKTPFRDKSKQKQMEHIMTLIPRPARLTEAMQLNEYYEIMLYLYTKKKYHSTKVFIEAMREGSMLQSRINDLGFKITHFRTAIEKVVTDRKLAPPPSDSAQDFATAGAQGFKTEEDGTISNEKLSAKMPELKPPPDPAPEPEDKSVLAYTKKDKKPRRKTK